MSKLRKSVIKQQERKITPSQKKALAAQAQATADATIRDNFLYRSSIRSFAITILILFIAILSGVQLWPFDAARSAAGNAYGMAFDAITGLLSVLFFVFFMIAWGNALEIRGNVIEWKHVLFCLITVIFVAACGGGISLVLYFAGAFAFLTYLWYSTK